MVKAKKYIMTKYFEGEAQVENIKLVEEELPPLKDGEILCESEWMSVDPYMRAFMNDHPIGDTMVGTQVAKIIESKNPKYPVGKHYMGEYGWRTHAIVNPKDKNPHALFPSSYLIEFGDLSSIHGLGIMGMPGTTAYFGLFEILKPKAGEVVAVSGAAGAVGSLVGQLAKIKGCTVIGFAGSDEKVDWLKKDLGFDFAFNYKKVDVSKELKKAVPKGVNCYFDNVGGPFSNSVLINMSHRGRIAVCGAVSNYNDDPNSYTLAPSVQPTFLFKELLMEGFYVDRFASQWQDGIIKMRDLMNEGKLTAKYSVTEGFENMPKAFVGVLKGENTGKAVVKI